MIERVKRWIPAIGYMGVIFFLSSLEDRDIPRVAVRLWDKAVHASIYAVLGALLSYAFLKTARDRANLLCTVAIGTLYGVSDEIHQAFVPGRHPDVRDVLADFIGVGIGSAMMLLAHRRFLRK